MDRPEFRPFGYGVKHSALARPSGSEEETNDSWRRRVLLLGQHRGREGDEHQGLLLVEGSTASEPDEVRRVGEFEMGESLEKQKKRKESA